MTEPRTTAAHRVRNPRGGGSQLREEIIEATNLLQQGSASSVTLRAVARAAGITAPSIYRHFPDVDGILRAVVDEAFDELEHVLRGPATTYQEQPVTQLFGVCRRYLAFAHSQPERYRLMFGGAWNTADAPDADETELADHARIGQNAFAVLLDAVAACIATEQSTSTAAYTDSTALWVGLHGLASVRETTPLFPWPPGLETRLARPVPEATTALVGSIGRRGGRWGRVQW